MRATIGPPYPEPCNDFLLIGAELRTFRAVQGPVEASTVEVQRGERLCFLPLLPGAQPGQRAGGRQLRVSHVQQLPMGHTAGC